MARKKISELTALETASLDTVVVGVDNGVTYKIELDILADGVKDRINTLDVVRLNNLQTFSASTLTRLDGIESQNLQLNSFTQSQNAANTAFTNGINSRLQTASFNSYTASISTGSLVNRLNQIESISGSWITESETSSFAITGSNVFKGQQIISGAFTVSISGNAFGVNENPTPNNIFWSYIPNDTNTTSIEPGWIVNIETIGTYTVTNVEYDYPFVKITLDDGLLELPYRCNGYFSLPSSELKFGTDGILKISGSLSVSGSITGSTNFNTIVNKPTLISSSAQISALGFTSQSADVSALNSFTQSQNAANTAFTNGINARLQTSSFNDFSSSLDTRYAASGSAPTLFLLEAYANETYTLPGGFTDDTCRYSIVNNAVNVPSNWFNTSTYRFTPQKAGYWQIIASYDIYRNSEASMAIRKNGGVVAAAGTFDSVAQQVTKIVYLNGSTDYIDVMNTGGASNSRAQFDSRSWFQAKWIGE